MSFHGKVTESGVGPLGGVKVEITSGPNVGRNATTDTSVGQFWIDNLVPGELAFRASKYRYDSVERTVGVNLSTNLDFTMKWSYGTCLTSVPQVLFDLYKSAGGTETIAVGATPGRLWSATPDSPWIDVISPTPRVGSGPLTFRVRQYAEDATEPRRGTILVRCSESEGQNVWIDQVPNCRVSLEPTASTLATFPATGGGGSLVVHTLQPSCHWFYRSQVDWIITTGVPEGRGDVSVGFIVKPNSSGIARAGKLVVGETEWDVKQQ